MNKLLLKAQKLLQNSYNDLISLNDEFVDELFFNPSHILVGLINHLSKSKQEIEELTSIQERIQARIEKKETEEKESEYNPDFIEEEID